MEVISLNFLFMWRGVEWSLAFLYFHHARNVLQEASSKGTFLSILKLEHESYYWTHKLSTQLHNISKGGKNLDNLFTYPTRS